ncbi:Peptidase M50, putative membrane-associated zinc metallopeptidase [Rubrobacter xylanophilus DSM 9941]|uniref:Zinc metalloprotease n=1 Tax=Rubrobacter xylanophilus (strain DSM 9941 / JCM 11954 / NBRC 16129 / PRD-1) TaxID=266117 RepID=Q1AW61_RUBXD|nr:RIP metalloprotease RseP [Rubrobacter xylanophilus]ABG04367.1 Peptidase M50, putative membrane-associated zinc metallopeptidase [Rubrobacter xylanophilus DSM 9941]
MTVLVALLGLIFLIAIHELGHMLTAKALGVRVPEFGIGFGPALFKKKLGDTTYSFRIILLGGFARIAGMGDGRTGPGTYYEKPAWRRALIIFAGPFANILAAVLILTAIFMGAHEPSMTVERVVPGSFADEAGVKKGDRIVAVDGRRVESWDAFVGAVGDKRPGDPVRLVVRRDGEPKVFAGELKADPRDPERALVGVQPAPSGQTYGVLEAFGMAVGRVVEITRLLGVFLWQLLTGEQSLYQNVTGPVGIVSVSSQSVEQGFFPVLLAFISLNLALFNLLPILPLDGGHLLFLAVEKVIRKPVSEETMNRVAIVGLMLVLTLFLFATYADLSKIFSGEPFIPDR